MPTPPPWCRLTQHAPHAVLRSALRSGQSAMASEPSFIALGLAVRAGDGARVEVVAADHERRLDLAFLDEPVEARAQPRRARRIRASRSAPAGPGSGPSPAPCRIHRASASFSGKSLEDGVVGRGDVGGVAGERGPAERAGALAEERADELGHEAGDLERLRHPAVVGDLPAEVVAVVERDGAGALEREHGLDVALHRVEHGLVVGLGVARRGRRRPRPARSPPGCSPRGGRARSSDRSRRPAPRRAAPAPASPRPRSRRARRRAPRPSAFASSTASSAASRSVSMRSQ